MPHQSGPFETIPQAFLSLWLDALSLSLLVLLSASISGAELWSETLRLPTLSISRPDTITGTLEGNVFDNYRAPLPGARIQIVNLETGNQRATLTNARGHYRMAFLPLGKYRIEASKEDTPSPSRRGNRSRSNLTRPS